MIEIAYSLHCNLQDSSITQRRAPWEILLGETLTQLPIRADKSTLGVIVPVLWKQGTTAGKTAAHVDAVSMLVLDVDHASPEQKQWLTDKLASDGFCYFWHLTHSCYAAFHEKGEYRLRVYIPLDAPVPAARWPAFFAKACAYYSSVGLDPTGKDAAHKYFLPAVPSQAAFEWFHSEGYCDMNGPHAQPMPAGLLDALPPPGPAAGQPHESVHSPKLPRAIIEGQLRQVAAKKVKALDPTQRALGAALQALLMGHAYATETNRHTTMVSLGMLIANHFPDQDTGTLADIFARSQREMSAAHNTEPDDYRAIFKAIEDAQRKVQNEAVEKTQSKALKLNDRQSYMMMRAAQTDDAMHLYTEEDLQQIAQSVDLPVDVLPNYWVMLVNSAPKQIYIITKKGIVEVGRDHDSWAASIDLLRPTGLNLYELRGTDKSRRYVHKTLKDIAHTNGMVLQDLEYDNTRQTYAVHGNTLVFPCPKRQLTPRHHEHVERWLKALFGESQWDKARRWLSFYADTRKLLCALFLRGEKGIGKTLLAHGLARIWEHGQPLALDKAMGRFNFDNVHTPCVLADEGRLPGSKEMSSLFREFVSSRQMTVERKYGGLHKCTGARRVIIAANNMRFLNFFEDLEKDDLAAIQDRVWICEGQTKAKQVLAQFSADLLDRMQKRDIAEYALWLEQERGDAPVNERFAVVGSESVTSHMLLSDTAVQRIFLVLASILADAIKDHKKTCYVHGVRFGKGKLFMSGPALRERWLKDEFKEGPYTQPGRHLQKVGHKTVIDDNGRKIKTYRIDTELFYEYLDEHANIEVEPFRQLILSEPKHAVTED